MMSDKGRCFFIRSIVCYHYSNHSQGLSTVMISSRYALLLSLCGDCLLCGEASICGDDWVKSYCVDQYKNRPVCWSSY